MKTVLLTFFATFLLLAGCSDGPDTQGKPVALDKPEQTAGYEVVFDPEPLAIDRDKPISVEQAAEHVLNFTRFWELHHVDQEPQTILGNRQGYRFSIARKALRYGVNSQAYVEPGPEAYDDDVWEFVLIVDDGTDVSDDAKNKIKWSDGWRPAETHPIYLGRGYGFVWMTNAILEQQHKLKHRLNLDDGDDQLELIALKMQSNNYYTRIECSSLLETFGDEALPYLEKLLDTTPPPITVGPPSPDWSELVVRTIASIRTPKGTELLLQLYDSEKYRRFASSSLTTYRPFRPEAKAAYLEMLDMATQNGVLGNESWQACVQLDLKEAIPMFQRVVDSPKRLYDYRNGLYAINLLSGNPRSEASSKALGIAYATGPDRRKGRHRKADLAWAKRTLASSKEIERTVVHAINIFKHELPIKGGPSDTMREERRERRAFGLDLLRAIPDDQGLAEIKRLSLLLPKEKVLQELLGLLQ